MGDDAYRTQYAPPEPTVKILKRPTQNSNGGGDGPLMNGESKPNKQPIKTLQQVCFYTAIICFPVCICYKQRISNLAVHGMKQHQTVNFSFLGTEYLSRLMFCIYILPA